MKWWMGHYHAATPKRHYCYGNSKSILKIDKGRLQGWKPKDGKKVVTAQHYKDKNGKSRYKGTAELKGTENLVWHYVFQSCFVSWLHQQTPVKLYSSLVHLKLLAIWFPDGRPIPTYKSILNHDHELYVVHVLHR